MTKVLTVEEALAVYEGLQVAFGALDRGREAEARTVLLDNNVIDWLHAQDMASALTRLGWALKAMREWQISQGRN